MLQFPVSTDSHVPWVWGLGLNMQSQEEKVSGVYKDDLTVIGCCDAGKIKMHEFEQWIKEHWSLASGFIIIQLYWTHSKLYKNHMK